MSNPDPDNHHAPRTPDATPGEHVPRVFHAEIDAGEADPPREEDLGERTLDEVARQETIDLLDRVAWGEVQGALFTLDEALRLALEATSDAFFKWESDAHELGYHDEFQLQPSDVASLTDHCRLAYVGRLLRSLALMYGASTEFGHGQLGAPDDRDCAAPGSILRNLDAIVRQVPARRRETP